MPYRNDTKKKTKRYKEQNSEKVAVYLEEIASIPKEQIVCVDETGIDSYLYWEYGWSKKCQPLLTKISWDADIKEQELLLLN